MAKPAMRDTLNLVLAKVETVRGVDAAPNKNDDALLIGELDVQLDPSILERNVQRVSLSPVPAGVGRKLVNVSMSHEIKSSGDVGVTRPKIGTLLRGCGMRELLVTAGAANQIETPIKFGTTNGPVVTWAKTTGPTGTYGSYLVKCVTGGASATAELQVFRWGEGNADPTVLYNDRMEVYTNDSDGTDISINLSDLTSPVITIAGTPAEDDVLYAVIGGVTFTYVVTAITAGDTSACATALAAVIDADTRIAAAASTDDITVTFTSGAAISVVTTGTSDIALGNSGAEITPSWAGVLVEGQSWIVELYELGYMYRPNSVQADMETLTIHAYKDGMLHKVTACQGTVTFNGEAGQYANAQFEFTGNYVSPVPEPTPLDAIFEQTAPVQVELAQMSIKGDTDFCAQSFTITLGNTITPKDCMNAADGFDGTLITERSPTCQLNPEATYEPYTAMWADFSSARQIALHLRVGTTAGNIVRFYMDRATYTGLTYGNRNNLTTMEAEFQLNGLAAAGDDELRIQFC